MTVMRESYGESEILFFIFNSAFTTKRKVASMYTHKYLIKMAFTTKAYVNTRTQLHMRREGERESTVNFGSRIL